MTPPSLLHMTAPCREDFDIPYHLIGDTALPCSVAMVAGIHGNELNGVFVLSRLADYLHDIVAGRVPGLSLRARVLIVPVVNILGLNTHMRLWPFDKTDINRMFPGYDRGETTQRIAAAVLAATRAAPIRIDLHSSNLDIEELPHVRLFEPTAQEKEKAHWFGLPAMVETRIEKILTVSLMQAWKLSGGDNFVLRGGQAGNIGLAHCEQMYAALLSFLHRADILAGDRAGELEEDLHYFCVEEKFKIISEEAGFFVSKLSVGQWISAGDLVGYLYDGFTGRVRAEIHAPVAGLVLGLRRQPLVCEGDLIARLQCRS